MIIFSYYRAWIGIIPLIVSLQFVWKAQEHKSSEIDALDGAADSSKIFSNHENVSIAESQKLTPNETQASTEKELLKSSENGESGRSFLDFVLESTELAKLLLVNFGLHGRLALVNIDSGNTTAGSNARNMRNQKGAVTSTFLNSLDWSNLLCSSLLNFLGLILFWYLRPLISSCGRMASRKIRSSIVFGYSLLVSGLRHTAALVFRPFTKRSALTGVESIIASSLGPSESVMISKDSGSSVSSMATEDNQSEVFLDAIESSSVMDEKRQWNGFKNQENDQLEEWLEDSLIEGGIQTYRSFEDDEILDYNNNNYLQISRKVKSNKNDVIEFKPCDKFTTSTPDHSAMGGSGQSIWSSDTGVYTPLNLKKYLYDRYNRTRELGLSFENNVEDSYAAVHAQEQKRLKPSFEWHTGELTPSEIETFVETTKERIRNRAMNMTQL